MTLKKRLLQDPKLRVTYNSAIEDYIIKGYAERVEANLPTVTNDQWYIPHHSVFNPKKPDKLRVVFDCAAVYNGVSLNKQLLKGPDLVNSLIGVLLRFRMGALAVVADIEAMFHQVKVPLKDRDRLRFLWWPNGESESEPEVFRMTVHLFGAASSPSCDSYALQ